MAVSDLKTADASVADFVACPFDAETQTAFEAEMERNGQTYFDKEEDNGQVALMRQVEPVTWADKTSGYSWRQIKWSNVVWLLVLHGLFVWALVHSLRSPVKLQSVVWTVFTSIFSGFGMSVGAHRLWAHRSFKATAPLRFFLLVLQTMTINGSAFSYARDHRNHHKWPATDADPKNPGRGFFFAHVGWWLLKKRPEVAQFGSKVPLNDLLEESMLVLQHRFYLPLVCLFAFALPVAVPVLAWHERPITSFSLTCIRIVVVLHHLFTVNSVAHFWGFRPYDRFQKPTENQLINWISMGEGRHNYHHTFPFDYRNAELQWWEVFNPASLFIEVCILLRLASEPKKPSPTLIHKVIEHKGKPEYFVDIQKRNIWQRIAFGILDWFFGILLAQWPMWLVIAYKASAGLALVVL